MSRPSGPRIRSLKPEVWQDERLDGLGDFEHRLYVGLVTQADDHGRQSGNLALLKARVFPFDARPPEALKDPLVALERAGLIITYVADGRHLIQLTSWAEDQRVDKPTASRLPSPPNTEPRESSETPRENDANARDSSRETPAQAQKPQHSAETGIPRDSSRTFANPPLARAGAVHDQDQDQDQDQNTPTPNRPVTREPAPARTSEPSPGGHVQFDPDNLPRPGSAT